MVAGRAGGLGTASTVAVTSAKTSSRALMAFLPEISPAAASPTTCSMRLMTTGTIAPRRAVSIPTHGGARPSSAARTARNAAGSCTIAGCWFALSTATVVSSAPGSEMLVAGTTTSSVAPIEVKSKCSGAPLCCTSAMSFERSERPFTAGLAVRGSEPCASSTASSATRPAAEPRICAAAVAMGAPSCGEERVTTVPIGGNVGSLAA